MKRRGILLLSSSVLALLAAGCASDRRDYGSIDHHNIPFNKEQASEAFPAAPERLSAGVERKLDQATHLRELLPVRGCVRLETTEASIIGEIGSLVYIEGNWFVLDSLQEKIFQFDREGRFLRQIGRQGEGPGEYQFPEVLQSCWDRQLCVADQGNILIYDLDGNFVKACKIRDGRFRIVVNTNFIWDQPNRLYVGNFPSVNTAIPNHAIVQVTGSRFKILGGFEKRFAFFEERALKGQSVRWGYDCFEKIGNRIWTGSPYASTMEVYDLDGRLLGPVKRNHPERLTWDDFESADLGSQKEIMRLFGKVRNYKIFQVGPLVLSYVPSGSIFMVDIFDANGNLLKSGIRELGVYVRSAESFGTSLVSILPVQESLSKYRELLNEGEMEMLKQSGWRFEDQENDNPYLVIADLEE